MFKNTGSVIFGKGKNVPFLVAGEKGLIYLVVRENCSFFQGKKEKFSLLV